MKHKTTISFDNATLKEIDKVAHQRNVNRSVVVNEMCQQQLEVQNAQDMEKVYSPMITRYMDENFKAFEDRIASLMAKNSLDSAMSMFLLLDSISRSRNVKMNDLYQNVRGMAVKHVQKREDLLKMVEDKKERSSKS